MPEFNAGTIEATLELNRAPFEAGLAAARREAEAFERDGIEVPLRTEADLAREEAQLKLMDAIARAHPLMSFLHVDQHINEQLQMDPLNFVLNNLQDFATRHPIMVTVQVSGAIAHAEEQLNHILLQLQSTVQPLWTTLTVRPRLVSLAAAYGILQAAAELKPIVTPLRAVADIDSVLEAQAKMQEVVGHTIHDPMDAEPNIPSALEAQEAMQAAIGDIEVPIEAQLASVENLLSNVRRELEDSYLTIPARLGTEWEIDAEEQITSYMLPPLPLHLRLDPDEWEEQLRRVNAEREQMRQRLEAEPLYMQVLVQVGWDQRNAYDDLRRGFEDMHNDLYILMHENPLDVLLNVEPDTTRLGLTFARLRNLVTGYADGIRHTIQEIVNAPYHFTSATMEGFANELLSELSKFRTRVDYLAEDDFTVDVELVPEIDFTHFRSQLDRIMVEAARSGAISNIPFAYSVDPDLAEIQLNLEHALERIRLSFIRGIRTNVEAAIATLAQFVEATNRVVLYIQAEPDMDSAVRANLAFLELHPDPIEIPVEAYPILSTVLEAQARMQREVENTIHDPMDAEPDLPSVYEAEAALAAEVTGITIPVEAQLANTEAFLQEAEARIGRRPIEIPVDLGNWELDLDAEIASYMPPNVHIQAIWDADIENEAWARIRGEMDVLQERLRADPLLVQVIAQVVWDQRTAYADLLRFGQILHNDLYTLMHEDPYNILLHIEPDETSLGQLYEKIREQLLVRRDAFHDLLMFTATIAPTMKVDREGLMDNLYVELDLLRRAAEARAIGIPMRMEPPRTAEEREAFLQMERDVEAQVREIWGLHREMALSLMLMIAFEWDPGRMSTQLETVFNQLRRGIITEREAIERMALDIRVPLEAIANLPSVLEAQAEMQRLVEDTIWDKLKVRADLKSLEEAELILRAAARAGIDIPLHLSIENAVNAVRLAMRQLYMFFRIRPDYESVASALAILEATFGKLNSFVYLQPDLASVAQTLVMLNGALTGIRKFPIETLPDIESVENTREFLNRAIGIIDAIVRVEIPDPELPITVRDSLIRQAYEFQTALEAQHLMVDLFPDIDPASEHAARETLDQAFSVFYYRLEAEARDIDVAKLEATLRMIDDIIERGTAHVRIQVEADTNQLAEAIHQLARTSGEISLLVGFSARNILEQASFRDAKNQIQAAFGSIDVLLKAVPDIVSLMEAQAFMQAIVGSTLWDRLKAVPDPESVVEAEIALQAMVKSLAAAVFAAPNTLSAVNALAQMQAAVKALKTLLQADPDEASIAAADAALQALVDPLIAAVQAVADTDSVPKATAALNRVLKDLSVAVDALPNLASVVTAIGMEQAVADAHPIEETVEAKPKVDPNLWMRVIRQNMSRAVLEGIAIQLGLDPNQYKLKDELFKAMKAAQDSIRPLNVPVEYNFNEGTLFNHWKELNEQLKLDLGSKADLTQEAEQLRIMQEFAKLNPLQVPIDVQRALRLGSLPRDALNALAVQWGMNLGNAMAYPTKAALISALSRGDFGPPPAGGGGGDGGGGFGKYIAGALFGGAGAAAAAHLVGFSLGHMVLTAIPIAVSAIAAAGGGALLLGGILGTAAVGMGTDLAGIGQAAGDIRTVNTALTNLNDAISQFGPKSTQAAQAQQQLNAALNGFSPVARQAVLQAAQTAQAFKQMFDTATGPAEKIGAQIITQAMQTAEAFLPTVGRFAYQNMLIIQAGLQPFFAWMRTQGLTIFTHLEEVFQKDLPYAVHATTQLIEFLAKTIDYTAGKTGNLAQKFDEFITRWNGADFGKWTQKVDRMIEQFHAWAALGHAAWNVIHDLLNLEVHTGESIVKYLTDGLDKLHEWLNTAQGGAAVKTFFQVHKEQILDLMHAFGIFLSQVGPPLIKLLTDVSAQVGPLLPVVASLAAPLVDLLVHILDFLIKIPGVGNLLAFVITMKALASIPFLGIGSGFGLINRALAWMASGVIGTITKSLGGSEGLIAVLNKIPGINIGVKEGAGAKAVSDAEKIGADAGKAGVVAEEGAAAEEGGGLLATLAGPWGLAAVAAAVAGYEIYKHWSTVKGWLVGIGHDIGHVWDSMWGHTVSTTPAEQGQKAYLDLKKAADNYTTAQNNSRDAQQRLNTQINLMEAGKGSYQALQAATDAYESSVKNADKANQDLATQIGKLPKMPYADQLAPQIKGVDDAYANLIQDQIKYGANSKQVHDDTANLDKAMGLLHTSQQGLAFGYQRVDDLTKSVNTSNKNAIDSYNAFKDAQAAFKAGPGLKDLHSDQQAVYTAYNNMITVQETLGTNNSKYASAQQAYNDALAKYSGDSATYQSNLANLNAATETYNADTATARGRTNDLADAIKKMPAGAKGVEQLRVDSKVVQSSFTAMQQALVQYGPNSPQFQEATRKYHEALQKMQTDEDNLTQHTHKTRTGLLGVWDNIKHDASRWGQDFGHYMDVGWQHVDTSARHWFGITQRDISGFGRNIGNDAEHWGMNVYQKLDGSWQTVDRNARNWFGSTQSHIAGFGRNIGHDAENWGKNVYEKLDGSWQTVDRNARNWFGNTQRTISGIGTSIGRDADHWGHNVYEKLDSAWQTVDRNSRGAWGGIQGFFGSVGRWFTGPFTNFFTQTVPAGMSSAWHTVDSGARTAWGGIEGFLGGLGSKIGGIFTGAGSWLLNAGESIMGGLWDGMKSIWHKTTGWLSSLNPANWKGPRERDAAMLVESGMLIMRGLQHGLLAGWTSVQATLSGIDISTAMRQNILNGLNRIQAVVHQVMGLLNAALRSATGSTAAEIKKAMAGIGAVGAEIGTTEKQIKALPTTQPTAGAAATGGGGETITYNINIYNPVAETSEQSIHNLMQKIRFHGLLPMAEWGNLKQATG